MKDTKKSRPSKHNRINTHVSSWTEHAKGLHRSTLGGVLELKGEMIHVPITNIEVTSY